MSRPALRAQSGDTIKDPGGSGERVGLRGAALLVTALLAFPLVAGGGVKAEGPVPEVPAVTPGLVDWHPRFRANLVYWDFGIDRGRDRVLVVGALRDVERSVELLVLDTSGTVLANVSLARPGFAPTLAVDPSSGHSYVTSHVSTIQRVDTMTGAVINVWTYPFAIQSMAVGAGRIYVGTGGDPIQILDSTTGAVIGSLPGTPSVRYSDLILDPSGRWLLMSFGNAQALAVDLTSGAMTTLPIGPATFTNSKEGLVYVCARISTTFGGLLYSFLPQNGSLTYHGAACTGAMDENPVTGVVIDARGNLLHPNGTVGRVLFLGSGRFAGMGWRADGASLVGVIDSAFSFEAGTWDGAPRLAVFPTGRELFSPRFFPYCFFLQSVTGMNTSTVRAYLDSSPTPLSLDLADAFDCFPLDGLPDGFHTLRVMGTDLLNQQLDGFLNFETDGALPAIEIRSAVVQGDGSYALRGWANDSHLESVTVNGEPAALSGNEWSIRVRLLIGENEFLIRATDVPGNAVEVSRHVRYWPPYPSLVSNATGHFSIPVPPGWTSTAPVGLPTGGGVTLYSPADAEGSVVVSVLSLRDSAAVANPAYAVARVRESISVIESLGATVIEEAEAITIANHSAARLKALLVTGSGGQIYVQTAVIVPEWERTILITAVIPEAAWAPHSEDLTWILEGMQIDPVPTTPATAGLPVLWIGSAATAIGAAVGLAAEVFLLRRRGRPPKSA